MRVKFTDNFDYVIHRSKSGTPLQTAAYKASDDPITVKRDHGEAAVLAGAAVEVMDGAVSASVDVREASDRAAKPKGGPVKSGVVYVTGEKGGEK
jgi:hypothetical protein